MEKETGVIKVTEIHCAPVFKYRLLRVLKQPETDRNVQVNLVNETPCGCFPLSLRAQVILNIEVHTQKNVSINRRLVHEIPLISALWKEVINEVKCGQC